MTKIIDPDDLTRSTSKTNLGTDGNVWIDTDTKQIYLAEYGSLTSDGVTVQCLYSYLKEEWKNDNTLIKFPFPMVAITPEQFEFVNGWKIAEDDNDTTRYLLRDGGYAVKDDSGNTIRAFFGLISLGEFNDPSNDRAYYWQNQSDQTDIKYAHYTGPLNETAEYYRNKSITSESIGTGDGTTTDFSATLKWTPVKKSSITVHYTIGGTDYTATDDGNGNITGTDVSGTINYKTGEISLTFTTAPDNTTDINVDYTSYFDYSTFFKLFLRVQGKTYSQASLDDIGVTTLTYQAYRFPVSNTIDLKITHTDAEIDSNSDGVPDQAPYDNMDITWLGGTGFGTYDSGTTYNQNDVVQASDSRWYIFFSSTSTSGDDPANPTSITGETLGSGDGSTTSFSGTLASPPVRPGTLKVYYTIGGTDYTATDDGNGNITGTDISSGSIDYDTGSWSITFSTAPDNSTNITADYTQSHWKSYSGERQIGTNYYAFDIIIDANVSDSGNNPTAEQIYEFVQFELRQTLDIDANANTEHIGKVTDPLLSFVGDTLVTSTGVYIDDFNSTDTNRIEFYDVSGTKRTFPYVAAGAIYFNDNLQQDTDAIYVMFFEDPDGTPNSGDEYGTSGAIVVNDKDGSPIQGSVNGQSSVTFTFDYDNNTQGGRTPGTDANVVVVAIGLAKAQYVKATGTITRSTTNSISLVAALERNYKNPA